MLFILAVDVLQQMIRVANSTLHHPLSPKIPEALLAMQYADDTTIVANAHPESLVSLKLVLRIFSKVSGLNINYSKSSFVQFNLQPDVCNLAELILECQQTELLIT